MPDRAVGAVGAAVRVGAGNELARHHQPLLGKVEMEDAVAGRRVVRLLDAVMRRELAADRRLLLVVVLAGEDEVIVGDRRLPRVDRVAAGDLVEGVDRERRGAVGGRQQIRVDAQRRARRRPRPILVDAVRPDDLLGRRHAPRALADPASRLTGARSTDARNSRRPDGEDAAAPPDLLFLRRERHRLVGLPLRLVRRARA